MKKTLLISTIVLLAGTIACNKTENVLSGEGQIRFAPKGIETRALVTNDNIQDETFQVFDFMGTTKYIDETISYNDQTSTWDYASGDDYLWKTGTHKLFGFTAGAGTLDNNQKVTISKTLTTADQADLLYSEIVNQDAAAWKAIAGNTPDTPVELHFKHTFAAVAIQVRNLSSSTVTLNSASAAIPNDGSATVDFSSTETAVTYAAPTVSDSNPFITATFPTSGISLAGVTESNPNGGRADVMTQSAIAADGSATYMVVWPQTLTEGDVTVSVNYTMNTVTYSKQVKIPAVTWEAGNKYTYNLDIYPSDVKLTFEVQPWEVVAVGAMDNKTNSINMSNVTWMNTKVVVDGHMSNTVINNAYSVYMYYQPHQFVYDDETGEPVIAKYTEVTPELYDEDVYQTYDEDVFQLYEEDVYDLDPVSGEPKTYEEDVLDPETGAVIHAAGDPIILHHQGDHLVDEEGNELPPIHKQGEFVLDDEGEKILIHEAGDPVLDDEGQPIIHQPGEDMYDKNGNPIYVEGDVVGNAYNGYIPAQGYFTVNYPVSGKFKMGLIPAFGETTVEPQYYQFYIYDAEQEEFVEMDNENGEDISRNTVYFQVRAAAQQDHNEHKAQIDIWFLPDGETEWISAYSEIRANYALIIPATPSN